MLAAFTGKGLVPDGLIAQPAFLFAVAAGAGIANLLATFLGFPVSTTHLLIGALLGAGLAEDPGAVNGRQLWETFARPLMIAPLLAMAAGGALHWVSKPIVAGSAAQSRFWDALHFLSAGAVCLARGLNDTAKLAALMLGIGGMGAKVSMLTATAAIAVGGVVSARKVAHTMAYRITGMDAGEGITANLATSLLTTTASLHGLPVSTTHVSVGALLGMGTATGRARWRTATPVLMAWLVTLPASAVLSALAWLVVRGAV
jgi:PiT family inorganic phosphate transporter